MFPDHMGEYLKDYQPRWNLHRLINDLFTKSPYAFSPFAIVTQEKKIPDVSFYQGEINWDAMRAQTDAVIIRAGQNLWEDPRFRSNYARAKILSIKRGVYWFYDDRIDPGRQAALLVSLIGDDLPEMEVWIDWENSYGGGFGGLRNVVAMMEAIERALPTVRVGMYSGYWFFREHANSVTNAAQYNYLKNKSLWLAWYTSNAADVLIPAPWTRLDYWQFGTPAVGTQYGVQSLEIDMNYYNGTKEDFSSRYGGDVEPPPNGEPMTQWYRINRDILNIRKGPGTNYQDLGDLVFGDNVEVTGTPLGGWLPIARIWRVTSGDIEIIPSAWCKDTYCVETVSPIVEPPPPSDGLPDTLWIGETRETVAEYRKVA